MVKAKITSNAEVNPALAYFEDYQSGMTIADICRKYSKSRNTIIKYLRQNKNYKPSGSGYRVVGKYRKGTRQVETKLISFNFPENLLRLVDTNSYPETRTKIFHKALENYLKVPARQRYKPKFKICSETSYKNLQMEIETRLLKKLDRTKQDRTSKVIAAIEMYLVENNVLTY